MLPAPKASADATITSIVESKRPPRSANGTSASTPSPAVTEITAAVLRTVSVWAGAPQASSAIPPVIPTTPASSHLPTRSASTRTPSHSTSSRPAASTGWTTTNGA